MGDEPSQHPPDWWNISSPCCACRRRSTCAAPSVTPTRSTTTHLHLVAPPLPTPAATPAPRTPTSAPANGTCLAVQGTEA
ncbi:hypothetical protein GCM10023113_07470 [Cellulomonas oligotrophica]